jgi:heme-degrading monooxygenase HmoA
MLVMIRFRVAGPEAFGQRVDAALDVLRDRPGFEEAELVQNLDEPNLWALLLRWRDVGSYRRALQGYEAKTVVVPLLSEALDEPTAYEDPELL